MKTFRRSLLLLGGGLALVSPLTALAKDAPAAAPAALVSFSEPESIKRLERSKHKVDFFHLANHFESQTNKAFCGPTSAAIVLNTLRVNNAAIAKPVDASLLGEKDRALLPAGFEPLFPRYTQNNFFDEASSQVKSREQVFGKPRAEGEKRDGGIQLRQLHGMLAAKGLDVQLRVADDKLPDATIKAELKENLKTANDYIIINYARPVLGQKGGGHISPLGAYDQASDSFLILDVNPNGQSWVWVKADALIQSMRTPDTVENRGYLLVKEGPAAQASETK
jgi:hypothetical protein